MNFTEMKSNENVFQIITKSWFRQFFDNLAILETTLFWNQGIQLKLFHVLTKQSYLGMSPTFKPVHIERRTKQQSLTEILRF